MTTYDYKKSQKVAKKYLCKLCDYSTSRKSDWQKHLVTRKHTMTTDDYKKSQKVATESNSRNMFVCICGRSYMCRQNLFRHKKKCQSKKQLDQDGANETTTLLRQLVEAKEETIKALKDQSNKPTVVNNMHVYLDNTCGKAMTLSNFLDRLVVTDEDIQTTTRDPATGLALIMKKNLCSLSFLERPLHKCNTNAWFVKKAEGWREKDGKFVVSQARQRSLNSWTRSYKGESMDMYVHIVKGNSRHLTCQEVNDIEYQLGEICKIDEVKGTHENILPVGL